jgi:hypothetical protein
VRKSKNKKTRSIETDIAELSTELPDLDSLIDPNAGFDCMPIRDRLGVKRAAFSMREKSVKIVTFDARKVGVAAETIRALPEPGEYLHVVCGQEFAGFDLLPVMLQLAPAKAFRALHLTTLGFSRDNLAQLELLIRAKQIPARALHILCGDFFRRADSGLWDIGRLLAREWGFNFKSFRNHTKLILAHIGSRYFVIESSANLRSCANIETFIFTQSRALYDFHRAWITDCLAVAKE